MTSSGVLPRDVHLELPAPRTAWADIRSDSSCKVRCRAICADTATGGSEKLITADQMSLIDHAITANQAFVKTYNPALVKSPAPKLAIVTCMEPQLTNLNLALGLEAEDADVIRNAGNIINEDSIRSLVVSTQVLGTKEIMIIGHTECGMTTFHDDDLIEKLQDNTGTTPIAPSRFYAFSNVEANTRLQVQKVKTHPWISHSVTVRGFVYDVHTGEIHEVMQPDIPAPTSGTMTHDEEMSGS